MPRSRPPSSPPPSAQPSSAPGVLTRRTTSLALLASAALPRLAFGSAASLPGGGVPLSPPTDAATRGSSLAVQRVDTSEPVVALTFDACPTKASPAGFDRPIFDYLCAERIPATIFISGHWAVNHPTEAKLLADEPLMEFGNHSFGHPPFSRLRPERVRREIRETDKIIRSLGRTSVGVRPPFGDWAGWLLAEAGPAPVVLWDVVSGDAGGHVPPERMIETVSSRTRPGSIVIFHINGRGPHTKAALPEIVRRLRARGLRFVHVSELLRLPNARVVAALPGRDSALRKPYRPLHECD